MAYRDDREALLARAASLEGELERAKLESARAQAEARKLRREVGVLARALGRGATLPGPAGARFLPLVVASLVGAATLIGVNVGRVHAPGIPLGASAAALSTKVSPALKPGGGLAEARLVPAGMGLVSFQSTPRARVLLDGHVLGETPIESRLVPAGPHVFFLDVPGRDLVARYVVVPEGRTVQVGTTLDPVR